MTPSQRIRAFFTPERRFIYNLNKVESLAGVDLDSVLSILSETKEDEETDEQAKELLLVTEIIKEEEEMPFRDEYFLNSIKN